MTFYLCVDCGGSKTVAVIADAHGVVGRGFGGPSNFAYGTVENFTRSVSDAILEALRAASPNTAPEALVLPPIGATPFASAWFGVSGVDSPAAVTALTPEVSKLLAIPIGPHLAITNDTHLLAAPVRKYSDIKHAVAVIAGTGSNIVSFEQTSTRLEELGRIGGWGWILGDEGGGFSVGREAIRHILLVSHKAAVSGNATQSTLEKRILERFGITDLMEVLTLIHLQDPSPGTQLRNDTPIYLTQQREKRLSSLAPLVFAAAFEDNDPLALYVLKSTAGQLADQVAVLLGDGSGKTVKAQDAVISFGGSLAGIEPYRQFILNSLAEKGHIFRYVEVVNDPAEIGARALATV